MSAISDPLSPAPGMSDNMRGVILMVLCMAAFTLGDTCAKMLSGSIPISQYMLLRGVLASTLIGIWAWKAGAFRRMSRRDTGLVVLRGVGEAMGAVFFFIALFNMPFANVSALIQMMPLTITLGSALVFREPVGWRRWTAIAAGFVGMLMIVRPGTEGFNTFSLSALASVFWLTVRDLVTRKFSPEVPSLLATFVTSLVVVATAAIWSPFQDWQPMGLREGALVVAAAGFIIGGYIFGVMVMRVGDVGFVSPFRYTSLVLALLIGWAVFDEWPMVWSLMGAALIVATGLFTLWRETRGRQVRAKTLRT
ncbi:DMT family transporter [Sagittula sp. S175]|uniref:DMT family transporter n=1 Tax=Sagittula sp. S175 TaxID=3415129 RepID=UPI003C7D325B